MNLNLTVHLQGRAPPEDCEDMLAKRLPVYNEFRVVHFGVGGADEDGGNQPRASRRQPDDGRFHPGGVSPRFRGLPDVALGKQAFHNCTEFEL